MEQTGGGAKRAGSGTDMEDAARISRAGNRTNGMVVGDMSKEVTEQTVQLEGISQGGNCTGRRAMSMEKKGNVNGKGGQWYRWGGDNII